MTTKKKSNHGGAGRGQGRKKTHGPRSFVSGFWVEPSVAAKLGVVLKKLGMTSTEFFSRCIVEASEKV